MQGSGVSTIPMHARAPSPAFPAHQSDAMKTYARLAAAAANALGALGIVHALVVPPTTSAMVAEPVETRAEPVETLPTWTPPVWFPEAASDALWTLPQLDGEATSDRGPRLRARAAILADLDRGEILYARDADAFLPVASLTKITTALAFASTDAPLDATHCVDARFYPHRSGARSRFITGSCHDGWSYLGAAMVASDNRGAYGLSVASGLDGYAFVDRMDEVSAELGMDASWADPSGLDDDNLATARAMLKGIVAVAAHPDLANAASADRWQIQRREGPMWLGTTNKLHTRWETLAAKTGYTDTARYCFAQVIRTEDGRTLASVVLGSPTRGSRFDDTAKLVRWALDQG